MNQVEAIEIEGQIEVVGINLPQDMEQHERIKAQQSKVSDVLVVLERHRASVEQALADGIATELPEGIEAQTTLSFAESGAGFSVQVSPFANGETKIDRRQLTSVLPDRVTHVMTECIGANATRVGVWEPKVSAVIKGQETRSAVPDKTGKPSAGLGHIGWLLGAMGVGTGLIAVMLMR